MLLNRTSYGTWLNRVVTLVLGTAGLRIDRPAVQVAVTAALLAGTLALHAVLAAEGFAVWCALGTGIVYYGGNALLCAERVSNSIRTMLGENAGLRLHEVFLGVAFANQALALSSVAARSGGTLPIPSHVVPALVVVLTVSGLAAKYWATYLVGLDIYYYRDLFLRRRTSPMVRTGPYRFLAHPMYGLGNVHSYVPALVAGSTAGLTVAVTYHVAIYAFLMLMEKPFVEAQA